MRQLVAPHPDVRAAMQREVNQLAISASLFQFLRFGERPRSKPGLNDGAIYPPVTRMGLFATVLRQARQAPQARGTVRVIVLLAEFPDKLFARPGEEWKQLLLNVRDYYKQASYGALCLTGEVRGPYMLPETYRFYTNGQSGLGSYPRNAQKMVEDTLAAASDIDLAPYDPNGDGYVDALIVVHAGGGAETTPSADRINQVWSHKWTLLNPIARNGLNVYAYLTVPEDAKVGVLAHELGHLVCGWPDFYDADYSSAGLGNWCLMAGGSWNGGGDMPALPNAWCKVQQGWADVLEARGTISIPYAAEYRRVWRVSSNLPTEYILLENRQKFGYDWALPGYGLAVLRIDDTMQGNSQEPRYQVGLVQADGQSDLEGNADGGDDGDLFPGSADRRELTLGGLRISEISESGTIMTAVVEVQ